MKTFLKYQDVRVIKKIMCNFLDLWIFSYAGFTWTVNNGVLQTNLTKISKIQADVVSVGN